MSTLPIWLVGRGPFALTARFQVPDASGVLGNGTSTLQTLTGLVDEWNYAGDTTTTVVVPVNATREHEVPVEIDDTFVITEIMRSYQALNLLPALWYNADSADYVVITVTRGSNTWTFTGIMLEYEEMPAKGKSIARLTVGYVDLGDGSLNPGYA